MQYFIGCSIIILLLIIAYLLLKDHGYDGELNISEKNGKELFSFVIYDEVLDSNLEDKKELKFKIVNTREKHSQ